MSKKVWIAILTVCLVLNIIVFIRGARCMALNYTSTLTCALVLGINIGDVFSEHNKVSEKTS